MMQEREHSAHLIMRRDEVRAFDAWAIETLGIPGVVLMENAGCACAKHVLKRVASLENSRVCILCGTGNNGGDGYVIARHLLNQQVTPHVFICGDRRKVKGDASVHLTILERLLPSINSLDPEESDLDDTLISRIKDADLIVDALFGTGLRGALTGTWVNLINTINALHKPIIAVDIPSGLDCDTGEPLGAAIRAGLTVSLVAVKTGFTMIQAQAYTGEVVVESIGISPLLKTEFMSDR